MSNMETECSYSPNPKSKSRPPHIHGVANVTIRPHGNKDFGRVERCRCSLSPNDERSHAGQAQNATSDHQPNTQDFHAVRQ